MIDRWRGFSERDNLTIREVVSVRHDLDLIDAEREAIAFATASLPYGVCSSFDANPISGVVVRSNKSNTEDQIGHNQHARNRQRKPAVFNFHQ